MSAIVLYARATAGFDDRLATTLQILRDAAAAHPGRIVLATSLGAEDQVLTDLIVRHGLPIAVGTLETGALHPQTAELIGRTENRSGPDKWPAGPCPCRPRRRNGCAAPHGQRAVVAPVCSYRRRL